MARRYSLGKWLFGILAIVAPLSVSGYLLSRPVAIFLCQTFAIFVEGPEVHLPYSCGISVAEAWIPLFLAGLFTLSLGITMALAGFSKSAVSRSATTGPDLRLFQQSPINISGGHGPEPPEPHNQTSTGARPLGSMAWTSLVTTGALLVLVAIAHALTP